MKNKVSLLLEILWIVIGVVALLFGINVLVKGEGNQYLTFFLMSVIAFGFAWFRHVQRKKN